MSLRSLPSSSASTKRLNQPCLTGSSPPSASHVTVPVIEPSCAGSSMNRTMSFMSTVTWNMHAVLVFLPCRKPLS